MFQKITNILIIFLCIKTGIHCVENTTLEESLTTVEESLMTTKNGLQRALLKVAQHFRLRHIPFYTLSYGECLQT